MAAQTRKDPAGVRRMTLVMNRLMAHWGLTIEEQFAKAIGLNKSTWSNIKLTGHISRRTAESIAQKVPGLPTDFLLHGHTGGLTLQMFRILGGFTCCEDCGKFACLTEALGSGDQTHTLDQDDPGR